MHYSTLVTIMVPVLGFVVLSIHHAYIINASQVFSLLSAVLKHLVHMGLWSWISTVSSCSAYSCCAHMYLVIPVILVILNTCAIETILGRKPVQCNVPWTQVLVEPRTHHVYIQYLFSTDKAHNCTTICINYTNIYSIVLYSTLSYKWTLWCAH